MRGQPGFFDIDDRLKRLSDLGDQLETFRSAVDFELFRPELNAALSYTDRTEGGRPPFDPVLMFKILVIPIGGQRNVPDQQWLGQPYPSQEAERPRYARDDAAGQQCEIENPRPRRARVCQAKALIGVIPLCTRRGFTN